ncbi:hypothetical protein AOLI_G00060290 [Acnodon oligacanthus]
MTGSGIKGVNAGEKGFGICVGSEACLHSAASRLRYRTATEGTPDCHLLESHALVSFLFTEIGVSSCKGD